jgi:hypothetical protein
MTSGFYSYLSPPALRLLFCASPPRTLLLGPAHSGARMPQGGGKKKGKTVRELVPPPAMQLLVPVRTIVKPARRHGLASTLPGDEAAKDRAAIKTTGRSRLCRRPQCNSSYPYGNAQNPARDVRGCPLRGVGMLGMIHVVRGRDTHSFITHPASISRSGTLSIPAFSCPQTREVAVSRAAGVPCARRPAM